MPAIAQERVNTSAEVEAANNGQPVVVAAWWGTPERDNNPATPGLQLLLNPGSSEGLGLTEICLCVVLWDPYGPANITGAPIDVYEPTSPCGSSFTFKTQIHAVPDGPCGDSGVGTQRFRAAIDGGLVYFNQMAVGVVPGIATVEDAYTQVHNCGLHVWRACFVYDNRQYPSAFDPAWFTLDEANVLFPCIPTKIDFSVHPPVDLLAGQYRGLLFLRAVDANENDCAAGACVPGAHD
ncbi:MAG: hypothetical protein ACOYEW_10600 [Anaerolineae bacterium]|jgi:hypothetical protein